MDGQVLGAMSPRAMRGMVRQAAPVLWGGLALNLLALAVPLFSMLVYDKIIGNDVHESLWAMVIGMLVVMVLEFVLRMARAYVLEFSGAQWDRALDQRIQRGIFGLGLDSNLSLGALFGSLRDISSRRDLFTASALLPLMDIPFLVIYLACVAVLGTWIVFVPLLIGVGVIALQVAMGVVVESLSRRASVYQKERVDILHSLCLSRGALAGSIRTAEFAQNMNAHSLLTARASARLQFWLQLLGAIIPAASSATTVLVLVVGVYMVESQWMSTGQLIAASLLASRAVGAFLSIHPTWSRLKELSTALKELNQLLDLQVATPKPAAPMPLLRIPSVACVGLEYRYPQSPRPALQELSFSLDAGQMLAVVGKVGCAKSSLLRVLAGHYVPNQGHVSVGELAIRDAQDAQRLQYCVAFVEQFPMILEGTVETFLLAEHASEVDKEKARQRFTEFKLDDALRICGLAMNTFVRFGGTNISGGQRRVLAVIRALTMGRPLVVLDEPTAGLDSEVEKIVLEAIAALRGSATVVIATHAAALVALADRVLILDGGRHAGWVVQTPPKFAKAAPELV